MNPSAPGSKPPRRNWADLGPRLASAFVLLPVTAIALWIGGLLFALTVGLVFAGAYREWETMLLRTALPPLSWALVGLMALLGPLYALTGLLGAGVMLAVMLLVAVLHGPRERPFRLFGVTFIALVLICLLTLRGSADTGIWAGLFLATVVWATDTGAFFTGRQIGGEKLAPGISPSKTWSGAIGGLVVGTVAGTAVWSLVTQSPLWIGAMLAVFISMLGQAGDLGESAIKRRYRIKDSGDIIPGHGGLMDRLDSLTLTTIFVVCVGLLHSGGLDAAAGLMRW